MLSKPPPSTPRSPAAPTLVQPIAASKNTPAASATTGKQHRPGLMGPEQMQSMDQAHPRARLLHV